MWFRTTMPSEQEAVSTRPQCCLCSLLLPCCQQASLQKLKEGLKKSAVSLVDVGAARDELLNRAELGAQTTHQTMSTEVATARRSTVPRHRGAWVAELISSIV